MSKRDVEHSDNRSWTPLIAAIEYEHEGIVKLLLEIGKADVEHAGQVDQTPLIRAVTIGNIAILKLLLETGKARAGYKNAYGWTALRWAKEHFPRTEVIELLERST
jgi:ankyrin repeat protein